MWKNVQIFLSPIFCSLLLLAFLVFHAILSTCTFQILLSIFSPPKKRFLLQGCTPNCGWSKEWHNAAKHSCLLNIPWNCASWHRVRIGCPPMQCFFTNFIFLWRWSCEFILLLPVSFWKCETAHLLHQNNRPSPNYNKGKTEAWISNLWSQAFCNYPWLKPINVKGGSVSQSDACDIWHWFEEITRSPRRKKIHLILLSLAVKSKINGPNTQAFPSSNAFGLFNCEWWFELKHQFADSKKLEMFSFDGTDSSFEGVGFKLFLLCGFLVARKEKTLALFVLWSVCLSADYPCPAISELLVQFLQRLCFKIFFCFCELKYFRGTNCISRCFIPTWLIFRHWPKSCFRLQRTTPLSRLMSLSLFIPFSTPNPSLPYLQCMFIIRCSGTFFTAAFNNLNWKQGWSNSYEPTSDSRSNFFVR